MAVISDKFKLSARDGAQAFINTVLGTSLPIVYKILDEGRFPTSDELKSALVFGVVAGVAHIIRKLFSGPPKELIVDTEKTTIIDKETKTPLVNLEEVSPKSE